MTTQKLNCVKPKDLDCDKNQTQIVTKPKL